MKCAAMFIFVSLVLASESFAVLRPRFPVKAMPPFNSDMIVRGDDIPQKFPKAAAAAVAR
jgi:hypothetical protein